MSGLFDTTGFPPRWKCGAWSDALGWTHILSDLVIFSAYLAIPIALGFFVLRRRNVPFSFVFWLFVAFILSCGVTHLTEAIIFYRPIYRFAGLAKAVTATISIATVIALVRVMPKALRLPDIKAANDRLRNEVETRQRIQDELEAARVVLEGRTSELTLQSHRIGAAMESAWVIACQWVAETGEIVWEIGARRWQHELNLASGQQGFAFWHDLLGESEAARLTVESMAAAAEGREVEFQCSVLSRDSHPLEVRLGGTPDRRVAGAPATITGMARLI